MANHPNRSHIGSLLSQCEADIQTALARMDGRAGEQISGVLDELEWVVMLIGVNQPGWPSSVWQRVRALHASALAARIVCARHDQIHRAQADREGADSPPR